MKPETNPWISISDLLSSVILVILLLLVATAIIPKMSSQYVLEESMEGLQNELSEFSSRGMVVVNTDKFIVELTDITFESASGCIDSSYNQVLTILGQSLSKLMSEQSNINLLIEGHTDPRPVKGVVNRCGYFQNNFELSSLRAINVRDSLISKLQNDSLVYRIGVAGYGSTRMVDLNNPESANNRRIEIRILTD